MRSRKNKKSSSESYWQPATDMMAGLVLVVLLIMMLLLLYISHMNSDRFDNNGDGGASYDSVYNETRPTEHDWDDSGGGGGGGGGEGETTVVDVTESPYDGEDFSKAAVHVTVIDGETEKVIKEKGMTFELHNANNTVKKLNTYYPEKIEFSKFETTENGTFYLPEKIRLGEYSMKSLSVPDKYEAGGVVEFDIAESYDWPAPYELEFPLLPAKNIIRVQSDDAETEKPVKDCVYDVIAEEDITTLDGTVRYTKDETVDEIECDSEGYGESKELYLGKYRLKQKTVGEYYALYDKPVVVEVESRTAAETPVHTVDLEKTKWTLTLTDEYTQESVEGAVFSIEGRDDLKTDETGTLSVTDLSKDTTYIVKLKSLPQGYKMNETSFTFTVDKSGYIDEEPTVTVAQAAYITRIKLSAKDMLLRNEMSGHSLTVYDEDDNVVANVDTNGVAQTVEGLEPGTYTVEADGRKSTRITAQVNDSAEPTEGVIYLWTTMDFVIIFAALLLLAVGILITVMAIKRRKERKKDAE